MAIRFGGLYRMNQFLVTAGYHAMAAASPDMIKDHAQHLMTMEENLRWAVREPEFDFFARKPITVAEEAAIFNPAISAVPSVTVANKPTTSFTPEGSPLLRASLQHLFQNPDQFHLSVSERDTSYAIRRFIETLEAIASKPDAAVPDRPLYFTSLNDDTLSYIETAIQP